MRRRDFVALGAAAVAGAPLLRTRPTVERSALWRPPELAPTNLVLRANTHAIPSGPGTTGTAMTLGDGPIGPTLRMRTGDTATIRLQNDLDESTILHWHGLRVPEVADGHPRLAIAPGAHYDYRFEVIDRAGTYWYHAHPHHRTGEQVYRGMTGLLLVEDAAERALELPSGAREIAVMVADRRVDEKGEYLYDPDGHERMAQGMLSLVAEELVDQAWKVPLPPAPAKGRGEVAMDEAEWFFRYLAPWIGRRITGRSSGDGRVAKRPAYGPPPPAG